MSMSTGVVWALGFLFLGGDGPKWLRAKAKFIMPRKMQALKGECRNPCTQTHKKKKQRTKSEYTHQQGTQ